MKLIYRASTFNFEPQSLPTYRQPHAINWRYGKSSEISPRVTQKPVYHQPHAINWRWQVNTCI